jgi:BASS family bile acid:Na+ symporter
VKTLKWTANALLLIGFLFPFFAGHMVGMQLTANIPILFIHIIFWLACLIVAYKAYVKDKQPPATMPVWVRCCNYVNSDSSKMLLFCILFGYAYFPTLGGPGSPLPSMMTTFLAISLFVMGLNIKLGDWKNLSKAPKAVGIAVLLRWLVMPFVAFLVGKIVFGFFGARWGLDPVTVNTLIVALILLGTTPTGTASNTLTLIARGDLALSVSVTTVNSIISPIVQPALLLWLAGSMVSLSTSAIMLDLVKSVLVPVVLGSIIGMAIPKPIEKIKPILAPIAIISLGGIMLTSMARGTPTLLKQMIVLPFIFVAGLLHGCTGFFLGYQVPKLFKLTDKQRRAICFEVAIENAGLTQTIANTHFKDTPLTLIPALLYGKLQNFIGATFVLPIFQKIDDKLEKEGKILE